MNRAIKLPQYSDVKPFSPPEGVTVVRIDRATSLLADATCPDHNFYAAFLDGTAPNNYCSQMGEGDDRNAVQKLLGLGEKPDQDAPADPNAPAKKKGLLQKIFGGGEKPQQP